MSVKQRTSDQSAGTVVAADLCGHCRFVDTCAYCTPGRDPVFRCPGFLSALPGHETSVALEATDVVGLCATCERLDSCTLDRPLSGVWHCEDYC